MTSFEIAERLNVTHFEVMQYWRYLDDMIVHNRFLIDCGLCISEETENYLYNCSQSLFTIFAIHFNREFDLNDINFSNAKDFTKGGVINNSLNQPIISDTITATTSRKA